MAELRSGLRWRIDRRAFVFPFLLAELFRRVDDDLAGVVDADAEAEQRRLRRAARGRALHREVAVVAGALDLVVLDLGYRAAAVRAQAADRADLVFLADDQDALVLEEIVVDAVVVVIGERAGFELRRRQRRPWTLVAAARAALTAATGRRLGPTGLGRFSQHRIRRTRARRGRGSSDDHELATTHRRALIPHGGPCHCPSNRHPP